MASAAAPAPEKGSSEPVVHGRSRSLRSAVRRVVREPLVHFLVIGLILFGAYRAMTPETGQAQASHQIALTLDDLRQLDVYFESQWKRQPTPEEFTRLIESKVQEEILYREALAMGLDKDDTIVKRRMAQKMQFLAEDVAAAHEPSTAELRAWFEKNAEKFALQGRITFKHLYFSPDRRGSRAREDALEALGEIGREPRDSKRAAALADPFMYQDYYADRTSEQLGKEFGPPFAQALFGLAPGGWRGPVESGYGWHLIWVDSIIPGRVPAFEEVEPDVKTAWLADQKQLAWSKAYATMRAKYTLLLPAPPADGATEEAKPARSLQVPAPPTGPPVSTDVAPQ